MSELEPFENWGRTEKAVAAGAIGGALLADTRVMGAAGGAAIGYALAGEM